MVSHTHHETLYNYHIVVDKMNFCENTKTNVDNDSSCKMYRKRRWIMVLTTSGIDSVLALFIRFILKQS